MWCISSSCDMATDPSSAVFIQTLPGSSPQTPPPLFFFLSNCFSWLEWKHKTSQPGEFLDSGQNPSCTTERLTRLLPEKNTQFHLVNLTECRGAWICNIFFCLLLTVKSGFVFRSHCNTQCSLPNFELWDPKLYVLNHCPLSVIDAADVGESTWHRLVSCDFPLFGHKRHCNGTALLYGAQNACTYTLLKRLTRTETTLNTINS